MEQVATLGTLSTEGKELSLISRPNLQLAGRETPQEIETYVGLDWAACTKTRKSAMGRALFLRGRCVGFASKTQGLSALSSGEAELYAIGYGVIKTIFARSFLREVSPTP